MLPFLLLLSLQLSICCFNTALHAFFFHPDILFGGPILPIRGKLIIFIHRIFPLVYVVAYFFLARSLSCDQFVILVGD